MNRELKFRIYSFLTKDFYYFDIYEGYPFGIMGGVSEPMQFTGLVDSQNKEIYEGDIVQYKIWLGRYDENQFDENTTKVSYDKGAFYPRYINDECEDSWYDYKVYDLKIVGNSMQNPELDKNE